MLALSRTRFSLSVLLGVTAMLILALLAPAAQAKGHSAEQPAAAERTSAPAKHKKTAPAAPAEAKSSSATPAAPAQAPATKPASPAPAKPAKPAKPANPASVPAKPAKAAKAAKAAKPAQPAKPATGRDDRSAAPSNGNAKPAAPSNGNANPAAPSNGNAKPAAPSNGNANPAAPSNGNNGNAKPAAPSNGNKGNNGNGNAKPSAPGTATLSASFTCTSVTATSSKDLSNVVLVFKDGGTQRFEGLRGTSATFSGTGANAGKVLTAAYVKSGRERSGDGPGYGRHFANTSACVAASTPGGAGGTGDNGGNGDNGDNGDNGGNSNDGDKTPGDKGGATPGGRDQDEAEGVIVIRTPAAGSDTTVELPRRPVPSPDRSFARPAGPARFAERTLAATGSRAVALASIAALALLMGAGLLGIRRFVPKQ